MKKLFLLPIIAVTLLSSCGTETGTLEVNNDEDSLKEISREVVVQKVEFQSLDSLLITANLYEVDPSKPIMVLCHQANFCKYEYSGIAERFNELGYNCLAIDQRSGGPIADQPNETWLRAFEQGKPYDYLDAEQDIIAAIDYAFEKYQQKVILMGSSYSSTLCVYQGLENDKVSAVISFSPGNYFAVERGDLIEPLIKFEKPFFFTAARHEMPYVRELVLGRKRNANQIVFSPEGEGWHGARALWPTQEGGEEYWMALEDFLEDLKNYVPADTTAM